MLEINLLLKKINPWPDRFLQIKSGVRLLFFKKKVGKNTFIDKSAYILGWKHISIGNNTIISEETWLNVNRHIADKQHIQIGNNCYIGRRNFLPLETKSYWEIVS